jgi:hypothetical protein
MERLEANINSVKSQVSKLPSASWSATVVPQLTKLALHFRAEMTEPDFEIYLDGLSGYSEGRVLAGLDRCLTECEYMPRLKEIIQRIPDIETSNKAPDNRKLIRDFYEPYSRELKVHVFEYEGGYRQVKLERVSDAQA